MSKYWSRCVHNLVPYVPGEQPKIANLVKLNTNENPYGPSPKALAAMQAQLNDNLRLYPDPNADDLKQAIADYYQVNSSNVFVGNGSDEVLGHAFYAFFKQEQAILFPDISYSFYPVYSGLYEVAFKQIPLRDDFTLALDDYPVDNGGVIIANPNAPTGIALTLAQIEAFLQKNTESVVIVDEAYVDFGAETAVALTQKYPHVLVVQTLSKSRALAGLRVGFAIGDAALIDALERVKNSFNSYPLDKVALAGACAAMQDKSWFEQSRRWVIESRQELVAQLERLDFAVLPSSANFIFAKHKARDAQQIAQALRDEGVIVRHFNAVRIEQYLRITIGTAEQNARLLATLEKFLK